jgi:hypothetical protein
MIFSIDADAGDMGHGPEPVGRLQQAGDVPGQRLVELEAPRDILGAGGSAPTLS